MELDQLVKEFHLSCQNNNVEKLRDCLARGVDVNLVDQDWSGLNIAAYYGHSETLDVLLAHPDIEINKAANNATALLYTCRFGRAGILSRLVQVPELDINHQDEDGDTAAHLACYGYYSHSCINHERCVRILAETGRVDWNKRDNDGQTPLYFALLRGHSDIADIIMEEPFIDCSVKTEDGDSRGSGDI